MIETGWLRGRVIYVNGVEVERFGLAVDPAAELASVMKIMREAWEKLPGLATCRSSASDSFPQVARS